MELQLIPVSLEQKPVLARLMEFYSYDFSEFILHDVDDEGVFGYKYLDLYWTEAGRYPFLVKVDGHYAGFVLINQDRQYSQDPEANVVSEFFVMRNRCIEVLFQASIIICWKFQRGNDKTMKEY